MAIELQEFQLILLRRPDGAPEFDEPTSARIQREHVGFYAGIAIFAAGSVERARELANTDPAVRAGRLEVEAMTWWCPAGTMIRPGEPVTVED
jgi:hypothetical protein